MWNISFNVTWALRPILHQVLLKNVKSRPPGGRKWPETKGAQLVSGPFLNEKIALVPRFASHRHLTSPLEHPIQTTKIIKVINDDNDGSIIVTISDTWRMRKQSGMTNKIFNIVAASQTVKFEISNTSGAINRLQPFWIDDRYA